MKLNYKAIAILIRTEKKIRNSKAFTDEQKAELLEFFFGITEAIKADCESRSENISSF